MKSPQQYVGVALEMAPNPRFLHTMLRVSNLEKAIEFWTQVCGMRVLRSTDRPEQKYSLTFLGYGSEDDHTVLELTYNYGVESYDLGSAFGHVAIGVDDIHATAARAAELGYVVSRAPGPVVGGTTVIAFIVAPDGYKVELIQGGNEKA